MRLFITANQRRREAIMSPESEHMHAEISARPEILMIGEAWGTINLELGYSPTFCSISGTKPKDFVKTSD